MSLRRVRGHRKHRAGASHFALIPFIDMMTILVVFLLAHTADVDILPNTKNISIPQSLSDRKPSAAVVVMVTKDLVYVDASRWARLRRWLPMRGRYSNRSRPR